MLMYTLKERIMRRLYSHPLSNIGELSEAMDRKRSNIRDSLTVARRQGFVTDRWLRKTVPWGGHILTHCWELTESGKTWAKQTLTPSN